MLTFVRIGEEGEAGIASGRGYFGDNGLVEVEFNGYLSLLANSQSPSERHNTLFADDAKIREPGIYELAKITFSDNSGENNYRSYIRDSLGDRGYDHNLETFLEESGLNASMFRFEAIGRPPEATVISDTGLPELKTFVWGETISAQDNGAFILSAEASFKDASGLSRADLVFRSGDNYLRLEFDEDTTRLGNDTSQNQLHTTWLSIPFDTEPGTYTLRYIDLSDEAGNDGHLEGSSLADYLNTLELNTGQFTFTLPESLPKRSQSALTLMPLI